MNSKLENFLKIQDYETTSNISNSSMNKYKGFNTLTQRFYF